MIKYCAIFCLWIATSLFWFDSVFGGWIILFNKKLNTNKKGKVATVIAQLTIVRFCTTLGSSPSSPILLKEMININKNKNRLNRKIMFLITVFRLVKTFKSSVITTLFSKPKSLEKLFEIKFLNFLGWTKGAGTTLKTV